MSEKKKQQPRRAYDVLSTVLSRGDAIELSRLMSVSPQLVTSWLRKPKQRDITETGKYSPLDRIRTLILMVKEDDGEPNRAYPIGEYVATLLNGYFVPGLPAASSDASDMLGHIAAVLRETGEAVESSRRTCFEGEKSPEKKSQCVKDIDDAIVSLVQLKCKINPKAK